MKKKNTKDVYTNKDTVASLTEKRPTYDEYYPHKAVDRFHRFP